MSADIANIQQQVPGKLLLNRKMPALHISGAVIGWYIADLRTGRVESDGTGKVVRKSQVSRTEARAGCIVDGSAGALVIGRLAVNHGIDNKRAVISQKILAA